MAAKDVKTVPTAQAPEDFLAAVEPARRADAERLDAIFRRASGYAPRMWGPSIVGYGAYSYRYDSGHCGTTLAVGFSPRAGKFALYCMPDAEFAEPLLARLGAHSRGKSCIYIKSLQDVDEVILEKTIRASLASTRERWGLAGE